MLIDVGSSMPFIKAGRVRPLAVSMPQRLAVLPEVPTVAESGLPGFEAYSWQGVIAPAATPRPIIERLSRELMKVVQSDEVTKRLAEIGIETAPATAEQFAQQVRSQSTMWGDVIREAGIRLEA